MGVVSAQVKFGVTAGLNVSNETVKYGSFSIEPDWKAGFQAGVFLDCALTSQLSIIPELLFTQRGCKLSDEDEDSGVKATNTLTLNYLQLPINLAYKLDLGSGQQLFPFVGLYAGYGISGKMKVKAGSYSASGDVEFGSKDDEVKPLDFGLNIGVGYQYSSILFKLQYNLGLANLDNEDDCTTKNKNLAISVGFMF